MKAGKDASFPRKDTFLRIDSPIKGVLEMLGNLLWAIIVILVILWLLGWLAFHIGGGLIHILIIVAVVLLIYNLLVGRRGSTRI